MKFTAMFLLYSGMALAAFVHPLIGFPVGIIGLVMLMMQD